MLQGIVTHYIVYFFPLMVVFNVELLLLRSGDEISIMCEYMILRNLRYKKKNSLRFLIIAYLIEMQDE